MTEYLNNQIRPVSSPVPNRGQLAQMERKFGMFLHFGINTFGNVEWSDGTLPMDIYRPDRIDAKGWVRTAREAGMNFVVLTAKHHDGFCLWDTDTTRYSVRYSPNPTDVVAEVAEACRQYGLKLGIYYSLWDRNAVTYKEDFEEGYLRYMEQQLKELLGGKYGEVVELWLDGEWDQPRSRWRLEKLYDMVKRLQPNCQFGVNNTVGEDRDLAEMPENRYLPVNCLEGDPLRMFPSDFRLRDPHPCRKGDPKIYTFQGKRYYLPFEMTICSRGNRWFYSEQYKEVPLLNVEETVESCQVAFDEKNIVVINMPPNIHGELVKEDVDHLLEIARKLNLARESEN